MLKCLSSFNQCVLLGSGNFRRLEKFENYRFTRISSLKKLTRIFLTSHNEGRLYHVHFKANLIPSIADIHPGIAFGGGVNFQLPTEHPDSASHPSERHSVLFPRDVGPREPFNHTRHRNALAFTEIDFAPYMGTLSFFRKYRLTKVWKVD